MSYYLTKANPKKWRLQDYLKDHPGADAAGWWSEVCTDAKRGDTLFIGLSGEEAGIYARAIISSDPYPNIPDQEYNVSHADDFKERLGANVDSFQNLIDPIGHPILERELRTITVLNGVADWLHVQGARRHIIPEEGEAIDRLIRRYSSRA